MLPSAGRHRGCRASAVVACACCIFWSLLQQSASQTCASGLLRLDPYPAARFDECFPNSVITANTIKALCGVSFLATITEAGIVQLAPLSNETYNYSYPGPRQVSSVAFPCQQLNASGFLDAGSNTSATVMFFDDVRGPLSNLTATGPDRLTLSIAHTYGYRGPGPACRYNYTVVSGCVLGAAATGSEPACPPNYAVTTGIQDIKYCSPCPPGTSAPAGGPCTPCPPGYENPIYGGSCTVCAPGYYAAQAGTPVCSVCTIPGLSNKWNDGMNCQDCPPGSFASTTNPAQCQRCRQGVKCCTVNSSPDCMPCAGDPLATAPNYTSIFALVSATPSTCLASKVARCTPRFQVTIDSSCTISLVGLPQLDPREVFCQWSGSVGIRGPAANATADLASFPPGQSAGYSLLTATLTPSTAAPFLDFQLAPARCTLRYRALTAPAATLLGIPPAACPPSSPGCPSPTCPPGTYLPQTPSAPVPPCLPCPPGTFSATPSTAPSCTPCPAGYFASKYGSKACSRCPPATPLTIGKGAASCLPCDAGSTAAGINKCNTCPANSIKYFPGSPNCLGNSYGLVCCAAGQCKGQVACPPKLPPPLNDIAASAVLRLVSTNLSLPQCRGAFLLTCLGRNAAVALTYSGLGFRLEPIMQPACTRGSPRYPITLFGGFASPTRAIATLTNIPAGGAPPPAGIPNLTAYELLSAPPYRILTIALASRQDPEISPTPTPTPCTATFRVQAGQAFGLTPKPAPPACPASAIPTVRAGRLFCTFCPSGQYKAGATCVPCPQGTYQDLVGATSCNPCPLGATCPVGSISFIPCPPGYYTNNPMDTACLPCPADTYGNRVGQAPACLPCPPLTRSPEGSGVCGVPFPQP